jgi:type II secretory ATPase GspE/PulE/Tfp pilus assembly ATPase PilB-like protein
VLTSNVKDLIIQRAQEYEIKAAARREGMKTLRENGIRKVLEGVTSLEEVLRVTAPDEPIDKEGAKGPGIKESK